MFCCCFHRRTQTPRTGICPSKVWRAYRTSCLRTNWQTPFTWDFRRSNINWAVSGRGQHKKTNDRFYLCACNPFAEGSWSMPNFNNLSMVLPSAPLLLQQPEDVIVCDAGNVPHKCRSSFTSCECTHIVDLPLGSATELVVFDTGSYTPHTHARGTHFAIS